MGARFGLGASTGLVAPLLADTISAASSPRSAAPAAASAGSRLRLAVIRGFLLGPRLRFFDRAGVSVGALFEGSLELASTMLGRPIVNKHRAYTFHRPSALWIAQIMVDMAFRAAQILMFSVIVQTLLYVWIGTRCWRLLCLLPYHYHGIFSHDGGCSFC